MARKFVFGVAALTGARVFLALSQVVALPIIARYLTVEDFGAVALAMTIVIFSQILSDAGFGRSLIRSEQADHLEWSSVFWMLTGVGAGLFVLLQGIAPLWAGIFDLPQLHGFVAALAVVPFFSAVAAVPNAKLERDDRFPVLAITRAAAAASGIVTAIWMAVEGYGPWALIGQQIVLAFVMSVTGFVASGFRPALAFSSEGLKKHVQFARDNVGVSFIFTGQRQAAPILIKLFLGAAPVGLFAMSQRILNLPQTGLSGPMAQVAYVRMSRAQGDPARVGALYVAAIRFLSFMIIPGMAVLAASGHWFFPLALSDRWAEVATIFALAAPGFALEASIASAGVVFQAVGKTALRLRMATERAILRTLALAVAIPFGIEYAALAITIFTLLYTPRLWSFVNRIAPFDRRAALNALILPTFFGAMAWAGLALAEHMWTLGTVQRLLLSGGALLAGWGGCAAINWQRMRTDLKLFRT
ncbi:oligosaccharide flippase family protein [Actibacterium ureilyticum]|uniref:oligosaccharide flippase family protein n=1 Tax=Actibacterium ureilyticum TaxID=1590614 RepID=UPI001595CF6E|nr:oligosaccharide flippase family protein [Actibacterium ureilyticum]